MSSGPQYVIRVPASQGRSFRVLANQYLTIIDVEGRQIGDLVLFSAAGVHERLSTSCTRVRGGKLTITKGDKILSTAGRSMVTIVEDQVATNDIVCPPCDRARYESDFNLPPGHPSCAENLVAALREFGVQSWWLPDPFNVFMKTIVLADGQQLTEMSISQPGDRIVMRADMDLIGALSACPQDLFPANGYKISDLEVVVGNAPPERS